MPWRLLFIEPLFLIHIYFVNWATQNLILCEVLSCELAILFLFYCFFFLFLSFSCLKNSALSIIIHGQVSDSPFCNNVFRSQVSSHKPLWLDLEFLQEINFCKCLVDFGIICTSLITMSGEKGISIFNFQPILVSEDNSMIIWYCQIDLRYCLLLLCLSHW